MSPISATPNELKQRLLTCIEGFSNTSHVVLGDMVIDEMVYGRVQRLSREAPVIILQHQKTDIVMGGGANAVHNVAAYGAKAYAMGVWGNDIYAPQLKRVMEQSGIETRHMLTDDARPTTTKTRISGVVSASITQQMVRLDRESDAPLSPKQNTQLLNEFKQLLPNLHGLLLSDYGLGVVNLPLASQMIQLAKQRNLPIAVDSQATLSAFKGVTILTPNQPEAEKNVGFALDSREAILKAGRLLLESTEAAHLLITLGQDGMVLFDSIHQQAHFIPVFNRRDVFDVTGAGDTVVGTWLVAYASGASALEAAILGNLAASLVVRVFGSAVTSKEALSESLLALEDSLLSDIETVHI
jgi:D-glycero-beta-D-manno-heptose-7-phosphate kinase